MPFRASLAWSVVGLVAAVALPWYALQEGPRFRRLAFRPVVIRGLRLGPRRDRDARQMVAGAGPAGARDVPCDQPAADGAREARHAPRRRGKRGPRAVRRRGPGDRSARLEHGVAQCLVRRAGRSAGRPRRRRRGRADRAALPAVDRARAARCIRRRCLRRRRGDRGRRRRSCCSPPGRSCASWCRPSRTATAPSSPPW